ncbi:MAG TPA: hypothetical protein VHI52_03440 [Verrucomicrobiae bacterium]|nr:hypothetical protein [Verrucomicrobiae bacterium]
MGAFKNNGLAVFLAVVLAVVCLFAYVEHERLETVCRLTGDHQEIAGEDAKTPRQAIDSICTGMPFSPEDAER